LEKVTTFLWAGSGANASGLCFWITRLLQTQLRSVGTVSAQICADFLVSFTHQPLGTDLKNQQLSLSHLLAWKAAGLPTET
jgi:hypothetical protein